MASPGLPSRLIQDFFPGREIVFFLRNALVVGFSKNLMQLCWMQTDPMQHEFCFVHFLWERSQVEPRASGDSSLGGVMFPPRQSCDIFLGTLLPASGQAAVSKDEWEAWVCPDPVGVIPSRPEAVG